MRDPAPRLQLTVAALQVALVAAAGSGGAGTPGLVPTNGRSEDSGAATLSATAVAAGLGHSCALTRAGGLRCWGSNSHDQLGYGRTGDHRTPVSVSGLGAGVTAIASGVRHSCALTTAGGVKCWGYNRGALGDGTSTRRPRPVDVLGLGSGVTAIAAGFDHSCALTRAGGVKCWGSNRFGQLGDGTTENRLTPVDVSGLSRVIAIAAGGFQSCALTSAGGVTCWGRALDRVRLTPVHISGVSGGVTTIAAGSGHSCARTSAGGVKCWGSNRFGQLGDGTTDNRLTPVDVAGLRRVIAIAVGAGYSCALTSTGGVKCWGLNDHGQLGDRRRRNRSTPVQVSGVRRGMTRIAAGSFHGCVVTGTGGVKCWGLNDSGQLGDGTTVDRRRPVDVVGFGR